jgi:hypothetical protein
VGLTKIKPHLPTAQAAGQQERGRGWKKKKQDFLIKATRIINNYTGFLILSFRRVLYVMRFLLGISPASEC